MRKELKYGNFRDQKDFYSAIIGFSRLLRSNGVQVGHQATIEASKITMEGGFWNKALLKRVYRPIFCNCYEDQLLFDRLFDIYFKERIFEVKNKTVYKDQRRTNPIATAVMLGFGEGTDDEQQDAKNTSGGSDVEKLRSTDFSKLSSLESEELDRLALQLWKEMSIKIKKKNKHNARKGILDIRKTIRGNTGNGFDFIKLIRNYKKPRKHRLILLLDVSGSMDKYSFYLLKFAWSLKNHFQGLEAFIFSTRIVRVTDLLKKKDLDSTLEQLKKEVRIWGSGTQIGECLKAYNDEYGKRLMQSRNICLLLSDGLDTGSPETLVEEISKIKKRTSRLVWLNPLKGSFGYEPTQRSMQSVLSYLDFFQSANSLNSLLELEKILTDV